MIRLKYVDMIFFCKGLFKCSENQYKHLRKNLCGLPYIPYCFLCKKITENCKKRKKYICIFLYMQIIAIQI